ncbi:MAG: LamG domain-containing protein [Gallionella sp.]|jgi:hypothetical protein
MSVDDSYTKVLLQFDGDNGSGDFTDGSGKVWTGVSDAHIDTSQKVFCTGSGCFDGVDDYIWTPNHSDFNLGSGDFTIDCRIRIALLPPGLPSGPKQLACLIGQGVNDSNFWIFHLQNSVGTIYLGFAQKETGSWTVDVNAAWTPSYNTWYHVAVSKASNVYRFFVDGTQVSTDQTDTTPIASIGSNAVVGYDVTHSPFNGWIDEFRLSTGIARWTANFTPPADPYIPCAVPTTVILPRQMIVL